MQHNKQLEEFLIGDIHCQKFINQDLTFLQLSVICASQQKVDSIVPGNNTTAVPLITPQENNSPHEQDTNSSQVSTAKVLCDRNRVNNIAAPIQPVEPVVGLTLEEQCKKEEDPDLTLIELLGLTPCERHITTPLQTLNGICQSAQQIPSLGKRS